jgi:hypothetical protein
MENVEKQVFKSKHRMKKMHCEEHNLRNDFTVESFSTFISTFVDRGFIKIFESWQLSFIKLNLV